MLVMLVRQSDLHGYISRPMLNFVVDFQPGDLPINPNAYVCTF